MSRSIPAVAVLRPLGRILVLAGFGLFLVSFFLVSFELDDQAWQSIEQAAPIQEWHREPLMQELQSLRGQRFDTAVGFVGALDAAADRAEEASGDGVQYSSYDRQVYGLALARIVGRGALDGREWLWFLLTFGLCCVGGVLYSLPRLFTEPPGIRNDGVMTSSLKSRGWSGIGLGLFLILLYVALYFFPASIIGWIRLTDPISLAFSGNQASQWFFYGFLYTLTILVMGTRMLIHYRHSRYHILRTSSILFFQTVFAFLIPEIMWALNKPGYDFKNAWPLDYDFFFSWNLDSLRQSGALGWFILVWGIGLSLVIIPLFAFLFGKRWYCSWVCGCGGLAETLGDPFRHLSDKSLRAWRIERFSVHGVLIFAVAMTAVVLSNYLGATWGDGPLLASWNEPIKKWYGFLIGSIFAGVVGTGFYPILGNRVWCRFGCPLAAILGIVQRFRSRFRITTNGGQCISCGNCSTYCEMGIDVRWYAQRGQNLARASCVGCGVCAAVCPRGVLRLENGPVETRHNETSLLQIGDGRVDPA